MFIDCRWRRVGHFQSTQRAWRLISTCQQRAVAQLINVAIAIYSFSFLEAGRGGHRQRGFFFSQAADAGLAGSWSTSRVEQQWLELHTKSLTMQVEPLEDRSITLSFFLSHSLSLSPYFSLSHLTHIHTHTHTHTYTDRQTHT